MGRKKRPFNNRKKITNILIVCDGETEENYFNYVLKPYLSGKEINVKLDTKKFKDIRATKNYIKRNPGNPPFDGVVFLKDLENTSLNKEECASLKEFEIESGKKADNSFWFVFYNYPSIEYWYILHFNQCLRSFNDASESIKLLKTKDFFPEYEKPMPLSLKEGEIFLGKIDNALKNIKSACFSNVLEYSRQITNKRNLTNPMSDMAFLIEVLKASPEKYQKIYRDLSL
jgi:hypothetical protein